MSSSGVPFSSQAYSPTSPPVLPTPRQPSPLSFSSTGNDEPPSPPTPASSFLGQGSNSSSSSNKAPRAGGSTLTTPTITHGPSFTASPVASPSAASSSSPSSFSKPEALVPVQPSPDSLLLRSTFTALEHSTSTLKRLSKSVLTTASVVNTLAEQLEKAEDDLFAALGDLGRWLENGYGIQARGSIWESEGGIRKVNKEKRRREREEREVWVEHGLKAVKAELKRKGLAGHGAHTKFENTAKQFYHQTSVYLSPQAPSSSHAGPSSYDQRNSVNNNAASSSASTSSHTAAAPSDMAQAVRHAQWDLARYNHHSTLLYAVPPSSIGCLDLLVGLYGWVGGLLGETPGRKETDDAREISGLRQRALTTPPHRKLSALETPVQLLSRPSTSSPNNETLKSSLSSSLSHLARVRAELLHAWAQRDHQTALLEDDLSRRQIEYGGGLTDEPSSSWFTEASGITNAMTPVSSSGVEHKKGKKMHKIHRSVGGRLRDFLNPSASSNSLAAQAHSGERLSRISLDGGYGRGELSAPAPIRRKTTDESITTTTPTLPTHPEDPLPTKGSDAPESIAASSTPGTATPPLLPPKDTSTSSPRPRLPSRHSVQMPAGGDYVSPFLTSQYPPFDSSPDLRLLSAGSSDKRDPLPRLSMDSARPTVGGVGGLGAGGDEDERREEAGRKKEGVLWGLGSWEGLSKGNSGKGKWEKFWVVLDHSRIYEYRDNSMGMPESPHAVIDLKFASVREGRGTDRRFVFEIVTPSQGKRLYQATSETEMKLWLYAICNAIESCINGTSSVRTFDASKLRTVSGSLDDHALPARSKLGLGFNSRAIGLGFPLPPNGRRSMPPTPTEQAIMGDAASDKRTRKTSLKKVLKQSGERLSSAMGGGGGSGHRNSFGGGLDLPRPVFGKAGSRTSLPLTTPELDSIKMPPPPIPIASRPNVSTHSHSDPASEGSLGGKSSWVDPEIEKRVLEMAGLGLGLGNTDNTAAVPAHPSDSPNSVKRRVKSEAVRKAHHPSRAGYNASDSEPMTRSKSDDRANERDGDSQASAKGGMGELRRIADLPGNAKCADCGKGMKSSRWATISLRDTPMVLFICIRCCGVHRSLGTHISKPRSVDLDIWTPEMIALARVWGNERGNGIWESTWEGGRVGDERISDFIRAKYVEGRWLSDDDKVRFGLISEPVGRAI
ncbi:hypothetical protein IAU59_005271 [Kwoniella sp. CBS 9459]